MSGDDNDALNRLGFIVTWWITFIGCWIYCIAAYGFLLGVGLGWLPSLIAASVAAYLWPLVALGIVVLLLSIFQR